MLFFERRKIEKAKKITKTTYSRNYMSLLNKSFSKKSEIDEMRYLEIAGRFAIDQHKRRLNSNKVKAYYQEINRVKTHIDLLNIDDLYEIENDVWFSLSMLFFSKEINGESLFDFRKRYIKERLAFLEAEQLAQQAAAPSTQAKKRRI